MEILTIGTGITLGNLLDIPIKKKKKKQSSKYWRGATQLQYLLQKKYSKTELRYAKININ